MKIKKIYLGIMLMLMASVAFTQNAQLNFRFVNPMVIEGSPDVFSFDLEIIADQPGTGYSTIQVMFDYNTDAFGSGIAGSTIFTLLGNYTTYFLTGASNQGANSVLIGASKFPPIWGQVAVVSNTDYEPLMNVQIPIVDNNQLAGIELNITLMGTQNQYVTAASPSSPVPYTVVFDNDLLNFPLYLYEPLPFFLSEVTDPVTFDGRFIEIYNPSTLEYDFQYFDVWLNRVFNGNPANFGSVQLDGVLPAMGTYIIAANQSGFNTAYGFDPDQVDGTVPNGNGDDSYHLTQGDDLTTATPFDSYGELGVDGTGTFWEYLDSKAVRKYDVTAPNVAFVPAEWAIGPFGNTDMKQDVGDLTPGSHRADATFTGASSQAWRDKANWSPFIPDAGHNAVIPGSPGAQIDQTTYATCFDLTIAPPVSRAASNLTILSTPTGDGSLITYGTVTGVADVQKYLPADRWNYVSPPVGNAIANTFLHTWLYTYDAPGGDWDEFIVPEATPLDVMQGYADWTSTTMQWNQYLPPVGDTTTMYENGPLNNGSYNTALAYGTGPWGNGYNFVGNPFVSGIDWESGGVDRSGLDSDGFVVFNGTVNGQYVSGSGGTNGTSQFIAAQQGFFVQTTSGGGNFGVDNTARVHTTQAFLKSSQVFANRLSLRLNSADYSDETVIYFNELATVGKDFNYDSDKFFATDRNQLYTVTDGDQRAINTFNNMTETPAVDMGVMIMEDGEYSITASNIESFDVSTPLFLEDLKTSTIINLRETDTYSFSASPEDDPMRFIVHFADPLGIDDPINANVNNIYSYNKDVYVNFTGQKGEIAVYNLMGQEVYRTVAQNGLNKITLDQGNAAYVVKVIDDNTIVSKKVFLK